MGTWNNAGARGKVAGLSTMGGSEKYHDVSEYSSLLSAIACAVFLSACGATQVQVVPPRAERLGSLTFAHHKTFAYTGREQLFVVPAFVDRIAVVALGAAGAGSTGSYGSEFFGRGGRVYAIIRVRSRQKLYIFVGGQGSAAVGGFNGGGHGGIGSGADGDGGGGASDVRYGGASLFDRVLVAGGGGGEGNGPSREPVGGKGGDEIGGPGGSCDLYRDYCGGGGSGGTQKHGGSGGAGGLGDYSRDGSPGRRGELASGGAGGRGGANPTGYGGAGGGGGGGGYYGGGGGGGGGRSYASQEGGPGGGGGGGSSFVERSATNVHMWQGWIKATGDGLVVLNWN